MLPTVCFFLGMAMMACTIVGYACIRVGSMSEPATTGKLSMASMIDESEQDAFHTCNFNFSTRQTSQLMPPANESSAVAD